MVGTVVLNQYRLIRELGRGGMGRVFLARHVERPDVVVVKLIHPHVAAGRHFRTYFDREIESLSRLRHPCVVGLLDASPDDPAGPCLVMEFIPGVTLGALLARHRVLPLEQVHRLLVPLCRALTAGQARGIIHRDLKPANLMVTDPDTDHESIKVMDFGLAQLNAKPHIPLEKLRGNSRLSTYGTPHYIAPEAIRGDPVDHRSDIYALGVILFELLTGSPPFNYTDPATLLTAHLNERVPRLVQARPGLLVPLAVETVIRRCLEKYPYERPQSAREVAEAFGRACGVPLTDEAFPEPVAAAPEPASDPELPRLDRNAVVQKLQAWMPEPIAVVKLRGFVRDQRGDIVESQPGLIRVHLGRRPEPAPRRRSVLSWLGGARRATATAAPPGERIELLLHLARRRDNHLELTAVFQPLDGAEPADPTAWQARCDRLFHALRGHLMAQ